MTKDDIIKIIQMDKEMYDSLLAESVRIYVKDNKKYSRWKEIK